MYTDTKPTNMYLKKCIFISLTLLLSFSASGQSKENKAAPKPTTAIFQEEEIQYIQNWFDKIRNDANMDEETVRRFGIITSYYSLKMKQLGEDSDLTKIERLDHFKNLVEKQDQELQSILPEMWYEEFSKFYERLYWSVSKRLNQL